MADIEDLNEGADNLKGAFGGLKDVLNELAIILNKTANLTNDIAQNLQNVAGAGEEAAEAAEETAASQEKSSKILTQILKKEEKRNALLSIGKGTFVALVDAMGRADKETTKLGRGLNLSKTEAIALKQEFSKASLNLGDIAVNSERLAEANSSLNDQLGTAFRFSSDTLATFSKLTKVVGISAEAAGNLAFQSERSGKSFREVEENVLGASYGLQKSAGVALNMKGVLEATGKVTGQLRANLGANPVSITKAVTAAKLLGAELSDISTSAGSLLSFESSIEAELKAELITGKQLNLERARSAALAGDQETLAKELAANMGSFTDYSKLNVLQQNDLAASMGMSSDRMSDILFKQETMNMNAKQLRAQGKGELADKLEQLDLQEKLSLAQEKFQTILGDLSTVVLPIVTGFGNIVQFLAESKAISVGLISVLVGLAAAQKALTIMSLIGATAKLFGENAKFGPVGLATAIGGVVAMTAAIGAVSQLVGDGVAPPGGGPFTITDKFGATAVTAAGDGIAVSPNIKRGGNDSPSQPIIIQNNWDAFAASNGNGRRGLGGTQSLQSSPTFA